LLTAVGKDERWKLFPVGVWFILIMAAVVGVTLR